MQWQGFGKRKSTVGMPRPKKTKVEAVQGLGAGTTSTSTGLSPTRRRTPRRTRIQIEEDSETRDDCEEESDKEARQQANELVKSARSEVHAAAVDVRKAEAALRHEKRRAEERDRLVV